MIKATRLGRRQFLGGVSLGAVVGMPLREPPQAATSWTGTIVHSADGQRIPLAGG